MSNVNVFNLEMESKNLVSVDLLKRIRKDLTQDKIIQILKEHFPAKHNFDYDVMGFNSLMLEEAIQNIRVFYSLDWIKDDLKISKDKKLQIKKNPIEFRRNDDFEICLVLMSIGLQIGGWSRGSWRSWSEDDGEIFRHCVFNYDLDGLIYHSRYKYSEVEITDDGINWDNEKLVDDANYLVIKEPSWDREKFKDIIIDNANYFLEFLNIYYVQDEIIAQVFKNKQINVPLDYIAKIQGTDIEITDLIANQEKLRYAIERSGLIRGKKNKEGIYDWRVIAAPKTNKR